jgi:hypothetical protein
MERVPALLAEIARQLKVANELKALEMKRTYGTSVDAINAALKGDLDD